MLVNPDKPSISVLPFFPAGLPDETIGSRISRYHILRGQPTAHSTYRQLFERGAFSLTTLIRRHLDKLAEKLPGLPMQNLWNLQREGTLLPLFQRFSGTQTAIKHGENGDDMVSVEQPRRINGDSTLTHMCAECLIEDDANHGTPYLHRSHQIPGVTACWKHATKLLDCCPACRCPFAQPNQLILSAWLGCACGYVIADHAKTVQELPSELEVEFARFAQALLIDESSQLNSAQLIAVYKERATEIGYGRGTLCLKRQALFEQIEDFFGASLLSKIDPAYRTGKLSGWFHVISPSMAVETPLNRHLIFSYFLFRDAKLFLSRARMVIEASRKYDVIHDEESERVGEGNLDSSHGAAKQSVDQLLNELVENAQRYNYGVQQLWNYHFGVMKRLVKLLPNACDVIDERLRAVAAEKKRRASTTLKIKERDQRSDAQWAKAIATISAELYQKDQRPVRITRSRLIKAAKFNPKGVNWPLEARFPLANATSKKFAETTWCFYARRMLWTLQSLHDPYTPVHKIVILSGLEVYKAKAILQYFSDVTRCGGTSIKVINAVLDERGIGMDWQGPCPERSFYRAGRAYRLRTNRRGPIGGRAGDVPRMS
ncbi:TnsD family Tn7-like transposition protein [Collimonas humicola]|uniref:TnsD family Tn7-like transposition protein n=1 Tax=Collimonas humicola TaxID=2825886 RepID=UPI001B8D0271|nr:TnsD family Tn7-like transposition protein [Collimonas humicola]